VAAVRVLCTRAGVRSLPPCLPRLRASDAGLGRQGPSPPAAGARAAQKTPAPVTAGTQGAAYTQGGAPQGGSHRPPTTHEPTGGCQSSTVPTVPSCNTDQGVRHRCEGEGPTQPPTRNQREQLSGKPGRPERAPGGTTDQPRGTAGGPPLPRGGTPPRRADKGQSQSTGVETRKMASFS